MAMAFQLMNSILYMVEYGIQCNDSDNVNFNNVTFPLGKAMILRPFMYVNIFWMIMPSYILFYEMFFLNLDKWKKVSSQTTRHNENAYKKIKTSSPIENPPDYFDIGVNEKNNDIKNKKS